MVGQIKVREIRRKRYKPLLMCRIAGPLPIGTVLLACPVTNGTIFCLRGTCWRTSRMSSGVRVLWLGWPRDGVRWGGVSRVVKTASSRGRTGRTLFGHGDCCSPQARPRGALHGQPGQAECCGQASSVTSISHYGLLHRTSGWQALMLSRWWAADARVERMGARPNRVVVIKTALTCVLSPTVVRFWDGVQSGREIIW